jgi:hypothetical protein
MVAANRSSRRGPGGVPKATGPSGAVAVDRDQDSDRPCPRGDRPAGAGRSIDVRDHHPGLRPYPVRASRSASIAA